MTQLVPILHPPTGEILYMHPDLAAQQHRWLHPDPSVPTPLLSLPLFETDELLKVVRRLATQHPYPATASEPLQERQAHGR